jgi:phosphate starvation-inducible protein PhoH
VPTAAIAREFDLEPQDNARLASLCGPLDENLRLMEQRLGVEIRRRGNRFRVLGARADSTENVLRDLFGLAQGSEVTPADVHLALRERDADLARGTEAETLAAAAVGGRDAPEDGAARVPRSARAARTSASTLPTSTSTT